MPRAAKSLSSLPSPLASCQPAGRRPVCTQRRRRPTLRHVSSRSCRRSRTRAASARPTSWLRRWLSCALAQKACRDGYCVHYARAPRLFADLELAHGDGSFPKLFRTLTRVDLLILDDWGPDRLSANQRRDLMEIVEERYGRGSTLITSQLPVDSWHEVIGEPTFADAILDRLVHNAYRLALDGPSMRNPQTARVCRAVRRAADEEGRDRPQRRARSQVGEGSQEMKVTLDDGQEH